MLLDQTDFLVVGVIGPQGAGKSTVLSVVAGAGPFSRFVKIDILDIISFKDTGTAFFLPLMLILLMQI